MKASRIVILVAAAALVTGAPALAFHDGGVAACQGCHTMHNSQDGVPMNFDTSGTGPGTPTGTGYADLLLYENKSDVCLRCHAGEGRYRVWSNDPAAPSASNANRGGGDFVFLLEDNINDGHGGATSPILGYAAGHNVISGIKGTNADPVNTVSPGGGFLAQDLGCTSCHDPHGTGSYRLLYQSGQNVDLAFYTATIDADGISLTDGGGQPETPTNHNAYHSGYSEWCATCHGDFHAASGQLIHPSGQPLGNDIATNYNFYNGTSDCIANPPAGMQPCGSGSGATAYLPEVPFEDAATTLTSTTGPSSDSQVACMSCHRAHATSARDAGRWDFQIPGLAEDGDESGSYAIPNPYDGYQRSLCNKCHSQDEFDAAHDFTPAP